jgi:hypothetical protein
MGRASLSFAWVFAWVCWVGPQVWAASGPVIPPSFEVSGTGAKAVFPDLKSARYQITFDVVNHEARVDSVLEFAQAEPGFPLFQLSDEPTSVELDGEPVNTNLLSPSADANPVLVADKKIDAGPHVFKISHKIGAHFAAPVYADDTVESGFFMYDDKQQYLQNYLPTTYEYAQYAMTFDVSVLGAKSEEVVYANGAVSQLESNHWSIVFPNYFNSSAVFFRLVPKSKVTEVRFTFDNGSGQQVPAVIYGNADYQDFLGSMRHTVEARLSSWAQNLGPYPHPSLIINAGSYNGQGMEYSGAATATLSTISHELAHSYFGRGVMPANGNAGWIDEALATYIGGPYSPNPDQLFPAISMASHSPYYDGNDGTGYVPGMNLFAHFGVLFQEKDPSLSIKSFLKFWAGKRMHQVVTTEVLKQDLEAYSGMDLTSDFTKYVYGK